MTPHTGRGRIGEYAWWQLRDYAFGPALFMLLITFVIGVFPLLMTEARPDRPPPGAEGMYPLMFDMLVGVMATLGTMLATVRVVSQDRSPGLARFLFAKPVSVRRYYLQAWLVRGAAFLALALLIMVAVNEFIVPMPWAAGLASISVAFVLIGGVAFLLSVLTALDGGALLAAYLLPEVLSGLVQVAPGWHWLLKPLLAVMPPMHKLDDIRASILTEAPLVQNDLVHALSYGAACAVLATYLVRRLPLVR